MDKPNIAVDNNMQMAPLPGQSNFAIAKPNTADMHKSIANSRYYGKNASILLQNTGDNMNRNDIFIPREDKKKTTCCFRLFCPCYYLFCCCLCCEVSFKVTKIRFEARFKKWVNAVSKE